MNRLGHDLCPLGGKSCKLSQLLNYRFLKGVVELCMTNQTNSSKHSNGVLGDVFMVPIGFVSRSVHTKKKNKKKKICQSSCSSSNLARARSNKVIKISLIHGGHHVCTERPSCHACVSTLDATCIGCARSCAQEVQDSRVRELRRELDRVRPVQGAAAARPQRLRGGHHGALQKVLASVQKRAKRCARALLLRRRTCVAREPSTVHLEPVHSGTLVAMQCVPAGVWRTRPCTKSGVARAHSRCK